MTAEQIKIFNAFNGLIVGKDKGTMNSGELKRFTEYSCVVCEQYEKNFTFTRQNKRELNLFSRESVPSEDSGLLSAAKQAAGRKTLGNRKRGVKFINPPKHEYDEDFLFEVYERKSMNDCYEPSLNSALASMETKRRKRERQEQIERAQQKRKREQQRAEAERKEREYRLQQAIAAENKIKRKERIKKIIGTCVAVAVGIVFGILYLAGVW